MSFISILFLQNSGFKNMELNIYDNPVWSVYTILFSYESYVKTHENLNHILFYVIISVYTGKHDGAPYLST